MATTVQPPAVQHAALDAAAIRAVVDAASLAMVREFLAKRRYKKTLDTLSTELPEPPQPTTSSAVAKQLGLLKLHQSNTKSDQPFPTLLEALAHSLILKMHAKQPADDTTHTPPPTTHTPSASHPTTHTTVKPTAATATTASVAGVPPQPKSAFSASAPNRSASSPAAVSSNSLTSAAFTPASLALMSKLKQSAPLTTSTPTPTNTRTNKSSPPLQAEEEEKQQPPATQTTRRVQRVNDSTELLMEEFDDGDTTTARITPARTASTSSSSASASARTILTPATTTASHTALFPSPPPMPPTAITASDADTLRTLTFGVVSPSNPQVFSQSWKQQGFYYTTHTALPFGLVQRDGGPCGLIAAVQAEVMTQLLWSDWRTVRGVSEVSEADQQRALVHALATMLWRAGGGKQAKLAVEGGKSSGGGSGGVKGYKADGITECLLIHTATSYASLCALVYAHLSTYLHPHSHGLILTLYSLCLSRGLSHVSTDYDYEGCVLIGQHAYCTQELVNLAITGRAVSNVFDGERSMDGMVMRGIVDSGVGGGVSGVSGVRVGFVSLFEHYGYVEVGALLKRPRYPVWIVCSESHYSVLYCEDKQQSTSGGGAIGSGGKFDLFYYDELIKQAEVIRLTVDCSVTSSEAPRSKDLEPPLNDCIRTRWGKHARVSWNGTEPIL